MTVCLVSAKGRKYTPDGKRPALGHRKAAVYRLLSASGDVLYVGSTTNPPARVKDHLSKTGGIVASVAVEWFPSRADAQTIEAAEIEAFRPPWNKHKNPDYVRPKAWPPTGLLSLRRAWKAATPEARKAFLDENWPAQTPEDAA